MKMLVTAIGTVEPPIKIDKKLHRASFTLKVDNDRFFVSTLGLDQYRRMQAGADNGKMRLLIMGYAFSYRSSKCGQHHVGLEPILLIDAREYSDLIDMQDIFSQWFLASLLAMTGWDAAGSSNKVLSPTKQTA